MSNETMKTDFVFITNTSTFWCTEVENETWLYKWSEGNKNWISHRKINSSVIILCRLVEIPEHQAKLYHDIAKQTQKS